MKLHVCTMNQSKVLDYFLETESNLQQLYDDLMNVISVVCLQTLNEKKKGISFTSTPPSKLSKF